MPLPKKSLLILLLLVLCGLGGTMYGYYTHGDAVPLDDGSMPTKSTLNTSSSEMITVYVTGAVNQPGVVTLAEGSRVTDAVNACGGVLPNADMDNINMAQNLRDGLQVRVPTKAIAPENFAAMSATGSGQNMPTKSSPAAKINATDSLVNINTADEKALDTLPGIGPSMAQRIIEYRKANGAFKSPEEIKNVRGIGEAKYEKLKDLITI